MFSRLLIPVQRAATSAMVERSFALANQAGASVAATSFDATDTIVARDAVDGLADIVSSFASNNAAKLIGLPDFDGDGLEDFMVLRNQNKNTLEQMSDSRLSVYLE